MHVNDASIVISAVSEGQYPETDKPEIVLLGRSNVGKSSFINTLINRKGLARTSSQPGKTQTMNFYDISIKDHDFTFVDMPGYGYARVSKKEREKWGQMIETYLQRRSNLAAVFWLVDSRIGPTEDDRLMYDWLVYYGLHPNIIATKSDKISKNQSAKMVSGIRKDLNVDDQTHVIAFSAAHKIGTDEVWQIIMEMLERKGQ